VSWAEKNVKPDNATAANQIRAHPDHPVHQVHPEKMDHQAATESKAPLDPRVLPHHGFISLHHPDAEFAHPVHAARPVHQVHQVPAVRKAYLVKLVEMETMVDPALPVTPDPRVKLVNPACPDRKEIMVVMPNPSPKDRPDRPEHLVKMAHPDLMANQALQANPVVQDRLARLDHPAKTETLVRMDHRDLKVHQACPARMPNIALVQDVVQLYWQQRKPRPKLKHKRLLRQLDSEETIIINLKMINFGVAMKF